MSHRFNLDESTAAPLLSTVLENTPQAIAVLDQQMRYIAHSSRWLTEYKLPEQSLIGRSHYEVFPEISDAWKKIHQECLAGATHSREDDPFIRQDGQIEFVSWKIVPWRKDDGSVGGLILYTRVASPQYLAEKRNRQYEHEMRILLETTKATPWRLNLATEEFTLMGEQVEAMLGYTASSWKDIQTWRERIHPEDREWAFSTCYEMTQNGVDHDLTYRALTASGDTVWIRNVVSVIRDEDGIAVALTGLFLDISEQKQIEQHLRSSKEQYHSVIETSGDGFWLTDITGIILETNDAYARLSGYSKDELVGMHISELEAMENPEETARHIEKIIRTGNDLFETRHRRKNGEVWDVEISTSYIHTSGGRFCVFARDITERIQTQKELYLIAEVFKNTSEGIVITDPDGTIINVNKAYCDIMGYHRDEMIGEKPSKLKSGKHGREFYRHMWQCLVDDGYWVGEIWDRRKNGEIFPKWLTINAVHDQHGQLTHYVGTFSDISVLKGIEKELELMAYYDPLTGLPNRVLFKDRLENEINRCRRFEQRCAVLFLDLDRFKLINDTLGHSAGDELLAEVAQRIQKKVRANDTVARMGGDEFTLLLPALKSTDAAATVAQNILDELLEPIPLMGGEVRLGGSIGIAIYPDDGDNYNTLTRHADAAMYESKANGRGQYHFFSGYMDEAAHEHLNLERDLHRALEEKQFFLQFQPQINATNGTLVHCEALIRWQHPQGHLVSPDKFIPFAEDTGLIIPIGDWVIREVCRQIRFWSEHHVQVPTVAINLSARQFHQDSLVKRILDILNEYHVPVDAIAFEITETVAMESAETTLRRLSELAGQGFSIAIDDFGTGYSSLSYLKTFPVNKLKLDRSFVRDITKDANDAAISSAVIQLAHSLGLDVVAEGVETEEQKAFLCEQGCDIMQGYLFSKPLSSCEFLDYLFAMNSDSRHIIPTS